MNRAKMRISFLALAIAGAVAGVSGTAFAQTDPDDGTHCDKNVCNVDTGNCTLVAHRFDCNEITNEPGCSDSPCPAGP